MTRNEAMQSVIPTSDELKQRFGVLYQLALDPFVAEEPCWMPNRDLPTNEAITAFYQRHPEAVPNV